MNDYGAASARICIGASSAMHLPNLVESIGTDSFCSHLMGHLNELCGADHCAIFQLGIDSLQQVATKSIDGTALASQRTSRYLANQYWRRDPAIREVQAKVRSDEPILIKMDVRDLSDTDLRTSIYAQISERLVLAGQRGNCAYGLSILKAEAHGAFSDVQIDRVRIAAELLISIFSKHSDMVLNRPNLALALTSLSEVENCMAETTDLPRRELEVCARALYGLSTVGIALDLSIGEESVKTYRKRAYQRLRLGSQRELLTWYLAQWSRWQGNAIYRSSFAMPASLAVN